MELYAEQSVVNVSIDRKAKKYATLKAVKTLFYALAGFGFLIVMLLALAQPTMGALGLFVLFGVGALSPFIITALLIRRYLKIATTEFDYFVIGGKFRLVKVFGRKKRKMFIEIPFSAFQSVGKLDAEAYDRHAGSKEVKKQFAVGNFEDESKIFYAYYVQDGVKTLLHFEPSVEFMIAFKRSLPRVSIMDKSALQINA